VKKVIDICTIYSNFLVDNKPLALRTQKDAHMSIKVVKQPYGAIAYLMAHSLSTSFLGKNGTFSRVAYRDIFKNQSQG